MRISVRIILTAFLILVASRIFAAEALKCPQCGIWTISSSFPGGLEAQTVIATKDRITIPACGWFNTKTLNKKSKESGRTEYILTLQLTQHGTGILCPLSDWILSVSINGHFHEGSMGDFGLRRSDQSENTVAFQAWNLGREDPCDAGSAMGSENCHLIHNARLYALLGAQVQMSYDLMASGNSKAENFSFNLARFLSIVRQTCSETTKNSGAGAWALSCEYDAMDSKLFPFREWNRCIQATDASGSDCQAPTEEYVPSESTEQ